MQPVVIVGSGVLGLSTALAIKETNPNVPVTVIAKQGPHIKLTNILMTDDHLYTSPWAGAHFRPFPLKNEQEAKESELTRITQKKFRELAKTNPELSIEIIKGIEYFEAPDEFYQKVAKGYSEDMVDFKVLDTIHLPNGVKMGTEYQTWSVNSPVYLQWLFRKLYYKYQVEFVNANLSSLREVNKYVEGNPVIVNCSGMGLQYDGGYDPASYPIRGQTLLIRPPTDNKYAKTTVTRQLKDGVWTFCIPRPLDGGMIVGGTKQINDYYQGVRAEDTLQLKTKGAELFPELLKDGEFDIVNINVGFRPAREGGLNMSVERKENHPGRLNDIINNYGAGGMGYELSYGLGLKVVDSLKTLVRDGKL